MNIGNFQNHNERAETDDILEEDKVNHAIKLNQGSLRGGILAEYDSSYEMTQWGVTP